MSEVIRYKGSANEVIFTMFKYNYQYDYLQRKIHNNIRKGTHEFINLFTDHEVKTLILWSVIGPLCVLAYLMWIRFPRLRALSAILFVGNLAFYVAQMVAWTHIIPSIGLLS